MAAHSDFDSDFGSVPVPAFFSMVLLLLQVDVPKEKKGGKKDPGRDA